MQEALQSKQGWMKKAARSISVFVLLALVAISTYSATAAKARTASAAVAIQTDKASYLAGETVTISGQGFAGLESVMIRVAHNNGVGFDPFWVYADADGAIQATWTLPIGDVGANYTISASGSSGASAQAAFLRTASLTASREGAVAHVTAMGFNPSETVTVQMAGNPASTQTAIADPSGSVSLSLDASLASSGAVTVQAESTGSGLFVTTATGDLFTNAGFFSLIDQSYAQSGLPCGTTGLCQDDVPLEKDLTRMGRNDGNATKYRIFWSWNSVTSWSGTGSTGNACALFDTNDADANINFAVCVSVTNNGAQVVQSVGSPYAFTCGNSKNDRCDHPSNPITITPSQVSAGVFNTLVAGNLITATDPFPTVAGDLDHQDLDSTIEVDILKAGQSGSILPATSELVNVCSYPSAGNGGNNNPFDCIVRPASGFLQIVKQTGGTDASFDFTVKNSSNTVVATRTITTSGGTGQLANPLAVDVGANGTATYSITEALPTGWSFTNAVCTVQGEATGPTVVTNPVPSVTVKSGKVTTCTVTNGPVAPKLTVTKVVVNTPNGGTKQVSNFTLKIDTTTVTSGVTNTVTAGQHTVSEVNVAGYTGVISGDCAPDGTITLALGDAKACTITNTAQPGTLIVKKVVVNDSGGTSIATDFSFKVNSGSAVSFLQDTDTLHGKNTLTIPAGTYSITEPAVTGYTTTYNNCSGVVLDNGGTQICTITNNDDAGTLIVKKVVINNNGGSKVATDFSFQVNGGTATAFLQDTDTLHGKNTLTQNAGTYNITEPAVAGYTTTYDNCSNVSLANGGQQICTITNDDQAGTLIVKKIVINDNGGSKIATDFSFQVNGGSATSFIQDTDTLHGKNTLTPNAGTYTITEPAVSGYTTTYDNCSSVSLSNGGTQTCTITNNDQAGTLIVKKVVVNDNGGSKVATNFAFQVNNGSATSFIQDTDALHGKNTLTLDAGTYSITEPAVTGYTTTYDNCSSVSLANGATQTCTITNNDQAGSLIVKKIVINDNGGTKVATNFSFQVNGGSAVGFLQDTDTLHGSNTLTVNAGTYSVTEPGVTGYTTTYSNCASIVVANGGSQTCTITNNDDATRPVGTSIQKWLLHDTANFSILPGGDPQNNARVTFKLYRDIDGVLGADTCGSGGVLVGTEIVTITQAGDALTVNGFPVTASGLYAWTADYSGDQNNTSASTGCGDELTLIKAKDKTHNDTIPQQ